MLRVGLTGGIASGKTLVSRYFEDLGVPVIDADHAAREVVEPGSEGLDAVSAAFGPEFVARDGTLDRKALRQRVFNDDSARETLESILHPLIRAWMERAFERAAANGSAYAIASIPLLVETGQVEQYPRVLVVDAPDHVRRDRLARRDGIDARAAERMLASQAGRFTRLRYAHDVVANGDAVAPERALPCQVLGLDRKYRALA